MNKLVIQPRKLAAYPDKKDELQSLANDYKNLVVNRKTFKEAVKARYTLRLERYNIQKIQKQNNDILNQAKRKNKELAEKLIDIIKPIEEKINAGIKQIEKEKEEERQRKLEEERKRKEAQRNKAIEIISVIKEITTSPEERLAEIEKNVKGLVITEEEYGDFALVAKQNIEYVLQHIEVRRNVIKQEEELTKLKEKVKEPVKPVEDITEEEKPKGGKWVDYNDLSAMNEFIGKLEDIAAEAPKMSLKNNQDKIGKAVKGILKIVKDLKK